MNDVDEALARARAGDPQGMAGLYRAFSAPLYAYLLTQVRRREDAEDVLGDVFVSAIRDIAGFSGDAAAFRAWLYRIAYNRAIDAARRRSRRSEEPLAGAEQRAADVDAAEEAIARTEREQLWRAVAALPPSQRQVIGLRLAGGLTTGEIARVTGKRLNAVKALQHRALGRLGRILGAPHPIAAEERLSP